MSMEHLLQITLSNTLLAALLALLALATTRLFRRPALSHALWLLVLLKPIPPPPWNVSLPLTPADPPPTKPPPFLPLPTAQPSPADLSFDHADAPPLFSLENSITSQPFT